jgi:ammonium transporter, Amt family
MRTNRGGAGVKRKLMMTAMAVLGLSVLLAAPAGAQEAYDAEAGDAAMQYVLDNLWVFLAGVLVFFMQAGFAMVEAGMTRAKNVANIMAKNVADACVGILSFFFVGYMIAYGGDGAIIGWGADAFALSGIDLFGVGEGLTGSTDFFFQSVFAATAVTIASGALAERTKFTAYLVFSVLMCSLVYPTVVHWTWGGGLISRINIGDAVYSDFAGSGIVHLTGGVAAFVGAALVGARIGKYDKDGNARTIPGHNIALSVLGVFILWFGWFGFNGGSELVADDLVPMIALNTLLAAAAGGVGSTIVTWSRTGIPDVGMAGNGILGGLVGITAGCGALTPTGSVITGFIAGMIVPFSMSFIENKLKVDDPVGAVSVHGVAGIWGLLAVGLFAKYDDLFLGRPDAGLFYGGGIDQLIMQIVMAVIIVAFVGAASFIMFSVIKATIGLRVTEEEEMAGLDVSEHGGSGYASDPVVSAG